MTGSLRTNAIGLGIVFILLSSVIFAPLTQTATKFLAGDFPVFQIILFRSIGHAFWMLLFFLPQHGVSMFRANRPWLHLARSACQQIPPSASQKTSLATSSRICSLTWLL